MQIKYIKNSRERVKPSERDKKVSACIISILYTQNGIAAFFTEVHNGISRIMEWIEIHNNLVFYMLGIAWYNSFTFLYTTLW